MSVGLLILVVTSTGLLAWALSRMVSAILQLKSKNEQLARFPSRPETNWLAGNLTQIKTPEGYMKFCYEMMLQHGRAFTVRFGPGTALFLCHPDTIRHAIKNTEAKPLNGFWNKGYSVVVPWIGDGLLVSSGRKWVRNRKLLTPAFHFDILKPYVKVYQQAAAKCLKNFRKMLENGGDIVSVGRPLGLYTLDVMLTCALSFKTDLQEKGHPYERAVERLMELVLARVRSLPYLLDFIWWRSKPGKEFRELCDYAHSVSGSVIEARQETLKKYPDSIKKRHLDFLDILLTAKDEQNNGLTFQEIRDEVDTFLFEGHDTTKAALSWCLYCLGKYPEEQRKVWEEVTRVFADKQELEWEDIQSLEYTNLFVKEVMRMFPPAPQMSRVTKYPITLDGIDVPVGTSLEIHIYALHHNPLVWKDPETFDPQRFTPENFAGHDPYTYIPFSAGQRNCIGQVFALNEVKTVLSCLVKSFEFGFVPEHEKNILLQPLGTLRSKNGIKVKITPRELKA